MRTDVLIPTQHQEVVGRGRPALFLDRDGTLIDDRLRRASHRER